MSLFGRLSQALRWFDTEGFFEEARRVTVPGGVLATLGLRAFYQVDAVVDRQISQLYNDILGPRDAGKQ